MTKQCARCKRKRSVTAFCKDKKNPDGLDRWCRGCTAVYKKSYYLKNREAILKDCSKKYRRNRSKVRARVKRYYHANRARCIASAVAYRKKHIDEVLARLRIWSAAKRKTDIQYKLRSALRRRLNRALTGRTQRPVSAVRDLGCSIAFLKCRLEKRFHAGMTWKNYGTYWHIDHITPLSMFDLSNRQQALVAVNYKNLQPMLASENISKGGINRKHRCC